MSHKLESVIWNDDGTMAFERIRKELARHYRTANDIYEWTAIEDDLDIIETELKALQFIKEPGMLSVFQDVKGFYYLVFNNCAIEITKEKYDLLKEVLLWSVFMK